MILTQNSTAVNFSLLTLLKGGYLFTPRQAMYYRLRTIDYVLKSH